MYQYIGSIGNTKALSYVFIFLWNSVILSSCKCLTFAPAHLQCKYCIQRGLIHSKINAYWYQFSVRSGYVTLIICVW